MTVKRDESAKACPFCGEKILAAALKCRHCLSMLPGSDGRQLCGSCRSSTFASDSATNECDDIDLASLRPRDIALSLAPDLVPASGDKFLAELDDALNAVRHSVARQYGVVAPRVHISLDDDRASLEYEISIFGLSMKTEDLATGADAHDAIAQLAEAVRTAVEHNMATFLTREEVARLLNSVRQTAPTVVAELVPNLLALGQIRQVLKLLVREFVPINDLPSILNDLADRAMFTKDAIQLAEQVRTELGRHIYDRFVVDDLLRVFIVSPDAERMIQNSIQFVENSQQLMLDPNHSQGLQNNLSEALDRHSDQYLTPIVVVNGRIRRFVKELLNRNFPTVTVLSYSEIVDSLGLENLETIELHMDTGWKPSDTVNRASGSVTDLGDPDEDGIHDATTMRW